MYSESHTDELYNLPDAKPIDLYWAISQLVTQRNWQSKNLGNKVVGFRGKILGEARIVGDIDVETSKYIIEVTAGNSSKTSSEFEKFSISNESTK